MNEEYLKATKSTWETWVTQEAYEALKSQDLTKKITKVEEPVEIDLSTNGLPTYKTIDLGGLLEVVNYTNPNTTSKSNQ